MAESSRLRARVLLSLQRALLGAVPAQLRAVGCDWSDDEIAIHCYCNGPVAADTEELMQVVATEVAADFPDHSVRAACHRYDEPQPLSETAPQAWAYMRAERDPIARQEAIEIARADAEEASENLSDCEPVATFDGTNWHVEYRLTTDVDGGAPEYVIGGESGDILEQTYWQ